MAMEHMTARAAIRQATTTWVFGKLGFSFAVAASLVRALASKADREALDTVLCAVHGTECSTWAWLAGAIGWSSRPEQSEDDILGRLGTAALSWAEDGRAVLAVLL